MKMPRTHRAGPSREGPAADEKPSTPVLPDGPATVVISLPPVVVVVLPVLDGGLGASFSGPAAIGLTSTPVEERVAGSPWPAGGVPVIAAASANAPARRSASVSVCEQTNVTFSRGNTGAPVPPSMAESHPGSLKAPNARLVLPVLPTSVW